MPDNQDVKRPKMAFDPYQFKTPKERAQAVCKLLSETERCVLAFIHDRTIQAVFSATAEDVANGLQISNEAAVEACNRLAAFGCIKAKQARPLSPSGTLFETTTLGEDAACLFLSGV